MPEFSDTVSPNQSACLSCGATVERRYCPECGEHRICRSDYSIMAFLRSAFNEFTSLDSTIYRSFRTLLLKPGLLTAEYMAGRRNPYLGPIRLFIICNVLFFLGQSVTGLNTFTTPLRVHVNNSPHSPIVSPLVAGEILERGVTEDEYATLFDSRVDVQAKTLVIVMVPIYALILAVLYGFSRRFFVEHLVFSLHVMGFLLLLSLCTGFANNIWVSAGFATSDEVMTTLVMAAMFVYVFAGLRAAYGSGRVGAAVRSGLLAFGLIFVIQGYRLLLFFTTYLTI